MIWPAGPTAGRRGRLASLAIAASIVVVAQWTLNGHARQNPTPYQDCVHTPTARCLLSEADRIASSIDDAYERSEALAEIAVAYSTADMENSASRAWVTLLRAHAAASSLAVASPYRHSFALHNIAVAEAESGRMEAALETAGGIGVILLRDMALASLAGIQAENDDVVGALLTAARIEGATQLGAALKEVARAHAEAENLPDALRTAGRIQTPIERDWALFVVGQAFVRADRPTEALEVAERIDQKAPRTWLASSVAATAGDVEDALQLAVNIEHPTHRGARWETLRERWPTVATWSAA
jgi:hypothetical protein